MSLRIITSNATLLFLLGSLNSASASNLLDLEGTYSENEPSEERKQSRGWVDDTNIPEEEVELPAAENVSMTPKQESRFRNRDFSKELSRKDLSMAPVTVQGKKDIKDDTPFTGENANKHLPGFVHQEVVTESPYIISVNQVTSQIAPISAH